MSLLVILVAVAIAIGLVGIVLPLLPGSLLVGASILLWAILEGTSSAWAVFAVAATLIALGNITKYLVPGKQLQRGGIPNSTLVIGGVLGIVGFFTVPVIGLPAGFAVGIYLAEWRRSTREEAGPATWNALKAVGLGIAIEFTFTLLASVVWVAGVVLG